MDYNNRLDNYLKLPRTFDNVDTQYNMDNITNIRQQQQQQQQQQRDYSNERPPQNRQFKENDDPQGANFYDKFGTKYDAHKNKLKNDLQQEYNDFLQKVNVYFKSNY